MKDERISAIGYAIAAAAFYATNVPCAKLLLARVPPVCLAGLLYVGAGLGVGLLLGFVAYGLSIFAYVRAQRGLGAAKTSAYYAVAPFLGALLAFVLLGERPTARFGVALLVMAAGAALVVYDTLLRTHTHEHAHVYWHVHGGTKHAHVVVHSHPHDHVLGEGRHRHRHGFADG